MKKKFLALVLTLAMVLSLVPATALAAGDESTRVGTVQSDGNNGVKVIKTATPKEGGNGEATIDMEAYVTGTVTSTTQSTPLDIVLVLDQSGSMAGDRLEGLKTAVTNFINTITADATKHNVDHRIAVVGFAGGEYHIDTYYYANTELFVGARQYNYKKDGKESTDNSNGNLAANHYTDAFQTVTDETGKSNLTQSIDSLAAKGGTHPELGMEMANGIFAANPVETGTRQRIVVMFTDGNPGDSSDGKFDKNVANATVAQAYKTKRTYGATVYTVGLISNPGDKVKNFLSKVSSNYPDAQTYEKYTYSPVYKGDLDLRSKYYVQKYDGDYAEVQYYDGWGWYAGDILCIPKENKNDETVVHRQFYSRQETTTAQDTKYYMHTGDAGELNKIFTNIAQDTTHASVVVGDTSEMRDELSNFFVFDGITWDENNVVTSGVTVKKVAAQGSENEPAWASEGTNITSDVTVKVVGDKITVTGFDYSSDENCVVKTDTGWQGNKLVLSFDVKPNVNCYDWKEEKNYDTNKTTEGSQAGLYYGDNDSTVLNQSPQVPVPTYQVIYSWGTSGVTTSVTDSRHYISGQNATVNYTTVQKETAVQGTDGQWYRFRGWSENGTDIVGNVNITNHDVTLTPVLTEAYTVTYTDGVEEEVFADQVYSNLINGDNTPSFSGILTRDGYRFTGWTPEVAENVTGNATYTAQWQKLVEGEVVVTITGKNDTVQYDGTEKSVSGYDVTITQNNDGDTTYTKDDFTFSGTAEAKGTDVKDGGYSMGLKAEDFANTNSQFTNVTFVVVDGKLTIQPRTVTMTSGDATKPWDGTALTNDTVTVTGDGFVEGQDATYTVTGSQTDVGESDNIFTYTLKDGTTASNYDITLVFGKLTITEKAEVPYTLIFDANGGAWAEDVIIPDYSINENSRDKATRENLTASDTIKSIAYPTKNGATMIGWGTQDGKPLYQLGLGSGVAVSSLKSLQGVDVQGNTITLYAIWKDDTTFADLLTYTINQHYIRSETDADNIGITGLSSKKGTEISKLIEGKAKDLDWRGNHYFYDSEKTTVNGTTLADNATLERKDTVIDLYYYLDNWKDADTTSGEDTDSETGGDDIPDCQQVKIQYLVYKENGGTVSRKVEIATFDNDTLNAIHGSTAKANSGFTFVTWSGRDVAVNDITVDNVIATTEPKSGPDFKPSPTELVKGNAYTYTAIFLEDKIGVRNDDGTDKGDEIPDRYQVTINYVDDNTGRGKITGLTKEVKTIYVNGKEGKWASKGKVVASGSTATATGSRCYFSRWTNDAKVDTSKAGAALGQQTIENAEGGKTYTFTANFGRSSGGHSGGGTVTIPDDVPTGLNGKDHYAYVVGYPDGMVYPQKNITRAEVATIFFRLLTDETREANMTKSNGYNDMKDGAWYTCAVSTLSKMGIIKGYEDGSFKPDASISRAEFAAIAARFDPDGDKTPATFSDVSSHWAKDEISIAANHGWIKGYEDGSFKPDQKITRAETMTLVNRVLKRLPETKDDLHKDMKTWPDNQKESAWFYLAVQEATNSHYQKLKKDGTHETWESMRETRDWAALEK